MSGGRDTLGLAELNRATLARQLLLERAELPVVEAVERLGGLQAQEPKPPFVGLWTRLDGFRAGDLLDAIRSRAVVRATLMRATLHLMSAADFAAARGALRPGLAAAMRGGVVAREKDLDVDAVVEAARVLLAREPLDFNAIRAALVEEFPGVNDRALGYVVRLQLPLVMVPEEGQWGFPRSARFALADDWLGSPIPGADDPSALVLRYLGAFGPATVADFQAWAGLRGMKPAFDALRERLVTFSDPSGRELFDLPDAPRPDAAEKPPPRFLPEFDSLMLAHADRTRVLADEHRGAVVTKNLRVRATFLWDGTVRGTWRVERKRRAAVLHMEPFGSLPKKAAKALAEEGERLLCLSEDGAESFDVRPAD